MSLLHELVSKVGRVAVLVNPAAATTTEITLQGVQDAARAIGLQIHVLNASTSREIDAAFATLQREDLDGLFVAPDSFFSSRRAQLVTLAARDRIPAAYTDREIVAAGGLMSYGADTLDRYRQVGTPRTGEGAPGTGPSPDARDQSSCQEHAQCRRRDRAADRHQKQGRFSRTPIRTHPVAFSQSGLARPKRLEWGRDRGPGSRPARPFADLNRAAPRRLAGPACRNLR
jgi:hypothetical protein